MPDALPPREAVDLGGFEFGSGYRAERGQRHQDHKGGPHPDVHKKDRAKGPIDVGQKVDLFSPKEGQKVVGNAKGRLIDQPPEEPAGDRRQHHRREEQGQRHAATGHLRATPKEEAQPHAQHGLDADGQHDKKKGAAKRAPHLGVIIDVGKVLQRRKLGCTRRHQRVIIKAQADHPQSGDHIEQHKKGQDRHQQGDREVLRFLKAPPRAGGLG